MDEQSWQEMMAFCAGLRDSNNWAMGLFEEAQEEALDADNDEAEEAAGEGYQTCDEIDDFITTIEQLLEGFDHKLNRHYQATIKYPEGM